MKHILDQAAAEDEGLSTFLKIHSYMNSNVVKTEVESEPSVENKMADQKSGQTSQSKRSLIDIRLKEFKISGSIGRPGEKDQLS